MNFKDATPQMKTADFQIDIKQVGEEGVVEGIASTFGEVDRGGDIIDSGAFDNTIRYHKAKGTMPKMLFQHDPSKVIGIWDDMIVQGDGLYVKGRLLLDIPLAKETHTLLKAKALDGLSIGYKTIDAMYEDGGKVRRLMEVELWEVSMVTFPMNPNGRVTDAKQLTDIRDVERILRDAGVPNRFAKLVAAHGYTEAKSMLDKEQRDAGRGEKSAGTQDVSRFMKSLETLKETINAKA